MDSGRRVILVDALDSLGGRLHLPDRHDAPLDDSLAVEGLLALE